MIDEFVYRGCRVVVLGDEPEGVWREYFNAHKVSYRSYSISRNGLNPVADIKTKRNLFSILHQEQPDKVFTYQAKSNIYGCMAAHSAGIEDIYVMMGGLGSIFRSDGLKNMIIRIIVSAEYRAALKYAKRIFFQNEDDVATFEHLKIIPNREKAVMVHGSGVNLDRFQCKPMPAQPSFLFVGRLVKGKGVLDYLQAARLVKKAYPNVEFHIVGPFDSNPTALKLNDLQPYIDDKTVVFHGEQSDVRPFLEKCSCFVLPSYYGEGTPKAALEAMATGRPLIMADAVGCREVVRDGENGFLVSPKQPNEIASSMIKLIEAPEFAENTAKASRRMAEDIFNVCKVNDVICKIMEIDFAA
ncbi:glycosyltransferase family 4 protein [Adlercreutzia sp. ZJ304]|uniref:glycosyltransferase family 4 protein n=1 Tax=Adlercreutzia sp. ZJ304 TaxID=2709791 RepID=UPI001F14FE22|nr:glycosyltransferase family 4 protein [Adlercreutzia sp. ZJ304]